MKSAKTALEEPLSAVMRRFHDFFLGVGLNVGEANVALRKRDDFSAPLVTVLGHTYGVRIADDEDETVGGAPMVVETSVNVYDDEFSLERFRGQLRDTYEPTTLGRLVSNFLVPGEDVGLSPGIPLEEFFLSATDQAVELVTKKKKSPSKVTGRLVDTVLRVRFRPTELAWRKFHQDAVLFKSVVYLYCLRPFAAAYRQSLRVDPRTLR